MQKLAMFHPVICAPLLNVPWMTWRLQLPIFTVFIAHNISAGRVASFAGYDSILYREHSSVPHCGTNDEDDCEVDAVLFLTEAQ